MLRDLVSSLELIIQYLNEHDKVLPQGEKTEVKRIERTLRKYIKYKADKLREQKTLV